MTIDGRTAAATRRHDEACWPRKPAAADLANPLAKGVGSDPGDDGQTPGDLALATVLLQRAAAIVDWFWNEARSLPGSPLSIELGEASHHIHRAVIALHDELGA